MKPVFYSPLVIAVFIFVAFFFDFINVVDYDVDLIEYYRANDVWVFGNNLETTMLIVLGVSLFVFLLTLLYFALKNNRQTASSFLVFFGIIGSSIISFLFFVFVAIFAYDRGISS